MNKIPYAIIGAGPTGLGAGYRLRELGESRFQILEAASKVGGLSGSFVDEAGFTWDVGGHVLFSHYDYFDSLMDKALGAHGWLHHEREAWIWVRDRFIPYPFQNNIRYLPLDDLWVCLSELIRAHKNCSSDAPTNFREWILRHFGRGIADMFLFPYNFKVWAHPPENLSWQWIGERVSVVDVERVIRNVLFQEDDISWGPNNTFRFPLRGGTGAIWQAVADLIGNDFIRLGSQVVNVEASSRTIAVSSGDCLRFDKLLSTMPLDLLCALLTDMPQSMKELAKELKHSACHIVGIGLIGKPKPDLASKCWMYFPEDDCPFYRVTVFSNYSANNVPQHAEHWSLMTEISESSVKPVQREALIEDTIRGLINAKLIESRRNIVSVWTYVAPYAYPVPTVGRDTLLREIQPWLEKHDIYSRGRFGGWKYEVGNQDHSLMQGVEWASRMVLKLPEETYRLP
jgi:protoporphyrinogen oxidase